MRRGFSLHNRRAYVQTSWHSLASSRSNSAWYERRDAAYVQWLTTVDVCLLDYPALSQVAEEDVRSLVDAMNRNGDGKITLKEFCYFLNLDDDEPLYQSTFDSRRRNVNILQVRKRVRFHG